nr:phospholipase-like protein [Tanacetum cinerariifolium]
GGGDVFVIVVVRWCCGCRDCGGGVVIATAILSPSGEFSGRHEDWSFHLLARRRLFESCRDGKSIIAGMLLQKIKSEEFDTMNDHDVVGLFLLGVLELVLLGHEVRCTVSDWCFRLVDNIKAWDMYPWGLYLWPTLYKQLRDAIRKRWEAHFVTERKPESGPPNIFWACILETYQVVALNFFTHKERHRRALTQRFKVNVLVVLKGARPRPRLTPDAVEAQANWWLASKAFFDGDIREPPPISPLAQDEKIKSHDILIKQMYDDWQ